MPLPWEIPKNLTKSPILTLTRNIAIIENRTDGLAGPYYTLVMEMTFESLAALEKSQSETMGTKELSDWYQRFTPLVESGHREIYSVVD